MAAKTSILPPPRPPGGHEYAAAILTADPSAHPAARPATGPGSHQQHQQGQGQGQGQGHTSTALLLSYSDGADPEVGG